MQCIAKVAVSKAVYAIDKPYDYFVPPQLQETLCPGMRVLIPFGSGNRGSDGIVLSLSQGEGRAALKPILAQLDQEPVLDHKGIQLALWMRERYYCTLCDGVKTMLPAGLWFALRDSLVLCEGVDRERAFAAVEQDKSATELVQILFLWDGRGEMEQIRAAFGTRDPNPAIKRLVDAGLARLESSAQRGVGDKTERLAVLAVPAEEAMARVAARRRTAPLRYAVTEILCALGSASTKELCYFTGASAQTIKSLARSGILTLEQQEVFRTPALDEVEPAAPPTLNLEQQAAFETLDELCAKEASGAALLYGVTGSGKTSVYLRLIGQVLARGKTALVLVPEIALTPQLMRLFAAHFGKAVAVLHSALRAGERYDEWKRVKSGKARVVVGTRSAIFAPLDHLGLIVLDEEQEGSYKSENAPRYHARDVAKYRCVQHGALLLLCSATPSVETMYHASHGRYHFVQLSRRFNQQELPQVLIADLRQELRRGNGTSISGPLREELQRNLDRGEQSILFLNRRGSSRMVSCGECGHVPECPRCTVKLTHHSANGRLMCHYCGWSRALPPVCPECGGGLNYIGVGTQRVQEELEELFPGTSILRMDTDTITAAQSHDKLLGRFQKEKIPVLVGTQMVAKGLDFPEVTLVGVVDADLGLYQPDIRAAERTFSLITQVVGRAGRGEKVGRAVIQTYTPDNDVLRCAAQQDYDGFYREEILLRQLRGAPPFGDVLVLHGSGIDESGVLRVLTKLRRSLEEALRSQGRTFQLLGPAPASVIKVNDRYRYQLTLTYQNDRALRTLIAGLLRAALADREGRGVSVFADPDPQ